MFKLPLNRLCPKGKKQNAHHVSLCVVCWCAYVCDSLLNRAGGFDEPEVIWLCMHMFDVYIQELACLDCFCVFVFMWLLCIVQTRHIHIYIFTLWMSVCAYTVCNVTCVQQLHTKPIIHRCVRVYQRRWKLLSEISRFICILIKWLRPSKCRPLGPPWITFLSLTHIPPVSSTGNTRNP